MRLRTQPSQWAATLELTPHELGEAVPETLRALLVDEAVRQAAEHGHTPNGVANFWLVPHGDGWAAIAIIPIVEGQS